MILPQHDLAWVRTADGAARPFDENQLAASIDSAARHLGGEHEWLAHSVAAAIHLYACECLPQRTIAADEIAEVVEAVLMKLGYTELAMAYRQRHQTAEVRLDGITGQSPAGFELEFFRQLDTALRPITSEDLAVMHLRGLRGCVMQLRGARRWCVGCRSLAEEIVEHVRARATQLRPANLVALRLAVVE
jgi:hypothetical protein